MTTRHQSLSACAPQSTLIATPPLQDTSVRVAPRRVNEGSSSPPSDEARRPGPDAAQVPATSSEVGPSSSTTKSPDAPDDEFAFGYVNWRGVDGRRRVRRTGLLFLANGALTLSAMSLADGSERLFATSLIARPEGTTSEGAFTFSYEGVDWHVGSDCGLRFGSTEWHPREQLLYAAYDLDRMGPRVFAVADMRAPPAT